MSENNNKDLIKELADEINAFGNRLRDWFNTLAPHGTKVIFEIKEIKGGWYNLNWSDPCLVFEIVHCHQKTLELEFFFSADENSRENIIEKIKNTKSEEFFDEAKRKVIASLVIGATKSNNCYYCGGLK